MDYKVALGISPNHRGMYEYLGEDFVKDGVLEKSRQNLAWKIATNGKGSNLFSISKMDVQV